MPVTSFLYRDYCIQSATDYYPFGMGMPGRTFSGSNYKFGFNGKENDNEVKGDGNSLDFGARIYDPRIGRWLSVDKMASKGPWLSPYNYSFNNPILMIDPGGDWPAPAHRRIFEMAFAPELKSGAMTPKQLDAIIRGSEKVDRHQKDKDQFMHSEKPKDMSASEATSRRDQFIKDQENEFVNTKDIEDAYEHLGMELHPLADENCPTHGKRMGGEFTPTEYTKPYQHWKGEQESAFTTDEYDYLMKEAATRVRNQYSQSIILRPKTESLNNNKNGTKKKKNESTTKNDETVKIKKFNDT